MPRLRADPTRKIRKLQTSWVGAQLPRNRSERRPESLSTGAGGKSSARQLRGMQLGVDATDRRRARVGRVTGRRCGRARLVDEMQEVHRDVDLDRIRVRA